MGCESRQKDSGNGGFQTVSMKLRDDCKPRAGNLYEEYSISYMSSNECIQHVPNAYAPARINAHEDEHV